MCLISSKEKPEVASQDIKCYKILAHERKNYFTPYRDFPVKFNEVLNDEALEKVGKYFDYTIVESGYFHSYSSTNAAMLKIRELNRRRKSHGKEPLKLDVFEAYIPEGSLYYKGVFSDMCSKSLVITNVKI